MMKTTQLLRLGDREPTADFLPPFGCSVHRGVAKLIEKHWWPHPPPEAREEAASDYYVMAAHQALWDNERAFDLALDHYLNGSR